MAIESPLVSVAAISAVDFPDVIRQYRVTGVPKTVVNDRNEMLGALPEDRFIAQALQGMKMKTSTTPPTV